MRLTLWVTLLLSALPGLSSTEATLVYTANRHGEIEPCGCRIKQIGGLVQMSERISQIKKGTRPLFLDAGNSFFSGSSLPLTKREFEVSKANLIAKSYQKMGLFAFSPGERDFAGGSALFWELVKKTGAKVVSANLEEAQGRGVFEPFVTWKSGELKMVVTGVGLFEGSLLPAGIKQYPALPALKKIWKVIDGEKADQVVVLSHLGRKEDEVLAREFPGVFIVGSKTLDYLDPPLKLGNSFIFEVGIEGQRLGEVHLKKGTRGWVKASLTELGPEYDKPNEVKKLVQFFKTKKPKTP